MLVTSSKPSLLDLNQFLDPAVVRVGKKGVAQSIDPETGAFVLGYETTDAEFDVLHELCHLAEREPEKLILRPPTRLGFFQRVFLADRMAVRVGNAF